MVVVAAAEGSAVVAAVQDCGIEALGGEGAIWAGQGRHRGPDPVGEAPGRVH